jgi:hypothetical protein
MYKVEPSHPLVGGELILTRKVVEMLDQARCELTHSWSSFWSCGIDYGFSEVRVESVGFAFGCSTA